MLLEAGFTLRQVAAETASAGFIVAVPREIAEAFWRRQLAFDNIKADAIVAALMAESLETKCAIAFQSIQIVEIEPGAKAKIKREAVQAYRATLFGGLTNSEYVQLVVECRQEHQALLR
ncbi:MAG: hypothetical protein KME60_03525 [Cyanomargarita calcarea GSE-NOS-MK-12-04C]|uniref:Uncharacterized protein n=1 Tax=Cyanomargarita calcarea GSE-NOS-MK-12-04C TaxID=2839659 RepID=A0A951QI75_9CYAN|nr:hypothetical protein [Cyanomargarita calcarea GSE-NOS-MK-12-04C]